MKSLSLIAAIGYNNELGIDNHLLWKIPEDLSFYKRMTMGKNIIMGRKTLEALPNQSALVGRKNIVLTRNKDYEAKDVCLCHSVEDVLDKARTIVDAAEYRRGQRVG